MGWIKRYERAKTDEVAVVEDLKTYLKNNVPVSPKPTVIHYDYKLNHALFSKDFKEMTGLFDWEMTTIGNRLTHIGVAMSYWIQDDDPERLKTDHGKPPVTVKEGLYTRDEFLYDYSTNSCRDLNNIDLYLTFAYFKLAVICQQIYYRYK